MKILEKIYLNLPIAFQNTVVSFEGSRIKRRRYGGNFGNINSLVQDQSRLMGNELENLRRRLLNEFLLIATDVPYWKQKFKEYGVQVQTNDPFIEIKKLPILTKEEVKQNLERIVNPKISNGSRLWRHTSGTTGSGLRFPETTATEHWTWAFWWRYRRWHGLSPDLRCGYFGGRSLVPISSTKPPFWRLNRPGNQLMFSGYHLRRETAQDYINGLIDYDVQWLHGYPSMLALLANYVIDNSISVNLPSLLCITTGAENLSEVQKKTIFKVFKVPVVQHYGQAEAVANISECEHGRLHIDEDFSAVEIVCKPSDPAGSRLIGTNWLNPAFPLFRYDTGDIVTYRDAICPCGRPGRVIESIDGRKEDYLLLPNGVRLGRLDHIFKDMVNVSEAQFIQYDTESVIIRIVRSADYSDSDEVRLYNEIRQRIGAGINVKIDYRDSIQRGPNGKLRLVISHLPRV